MGFVTCPGGGGLHQPDLEFLNNCQIQVKSLDSVILVFRRDLNRIQKEYDTKS
jgi:hypothetical protein